MNITLVNEPFNVTLKKDPDLDSRITIDPLVGQVNIRENEGKCIRVITISLTLPLFLFSHVCNS